MPLSFWRCRAHRAFGANPLVRIGGLTSVSAQASGTQRRLQVGGVVFELGVCFTRAASPQEWDDTEVIPPAGFSMGAAAPVAASDLGFGVSQEFMPDPSARYS
jgi:hypothetical protein